MESLEAVDFIGSELKITLNDGRILQGVLLALDSKPNLLINNCSETSIQRGHTNCRDLGLVSVPNDTIQSVEMKGEELDKAVKWKLAQ